MRSVYLLSLFVLLGLYGCADTIPQVEVSSYVAVEKNVAPVDYTDKIEPILNARCVVCHSCYNSPCQLKLSSYEGLDRGASKEAVYEATRLRTMDPTRLFTDAQTTDEWRYRGFTSVTETSDIEGGNDSFLLRFLAHKKENPASTMKVDEPLRDKRNSFEPDFEDLACSATSVEVGNYLEKHPNRGMPYGFPPLSENEFNLIRDWLVLGAQGHDSSEEQKRKRIHPDDAADVADWEEFLNGEIYTVNPERDIKKMMTARYLYEHLFLAHISFGNTDGKNIKEERFYELVRSSTPPGKPLKIIATRRPFDKPEKSQQVYYRFRRIHSTIVHKTHMVFEMSESKLNRYKELFHDTPWKNEPVQWVAYPTIKDINPFAVFDQIPVESRYRFLLEDIHYIIMTFIRGPVCKGQVALNVVQDHFWLFFMDPDNDLTVTDPGFLTANLDHLKLPVDQSWVYDLLARWKFSRHKSYVGNYVHAKRALYSAALNGKGLELDAIWQGETDEHTPVLTVFRHFDSASVHKGAKGNLPKTLWVMDYPVAERIYYALVAGFDVYGNRGHQMSTRIFMDGLRQEAETYFLDFMPKEDREVLMKHWYGGKSMNRISYIPFKLDTGVDFPAANRAEKIEKGDFEKKLQKAEKNKRFLVKKMVEHINNGHDRDADGNGLIVYDDNYTEKEDDYPSFKGPFITKEDFINGFRAVSAPGTSFFKQIDEKGANVAYIRIKLNNGTSQLVTMVVHRYHKDVRTMLFEDQKLDSQKDRAEFFEDYIGSYPNYFFVVEQDELEEFLSLLNNFDLNNNCHVAKFLFKFGVNRAEDDFWDAYDWFQEDFNSRDPRTAGIFDLNRYYHLAVDEENFLKNEAQGCSY